MTVKGQPSLGLPGVDVWRWEKTTANEQVDTEHQMENKAG